MGYKFRFDYERKTAKLLELEKSYIKIETSGSINVAVVYPNHYALAMTNLGFLTLHRIIAQTKNVGVERFFPLLEAGKMLQPPYYSFEARRPLSDFDVLFFSFSYEGDFDIIPAIFGAMGIPVNSKDRNKNHPLLVCGGAAVASNPKAMSNIFDVISGSEAEIVMPELLCQLLKNGADMFRLAEIPGVWVPSLKSNSKDIKQKYDINITPAYSHIVTPNNLFGGAHIIEIMRGCPRKCNFCLARCIYSPTRVLRAENLFKQVEKFNDLSKIALVAPSLFDYPNLECVLDKLQTSGLSIKNSSVKWEKLNKNILKILRKSKVKSLTLAPESGSEKMRIAINKPLEEQKFINTLKMIFEHGFESVKLYFIIGLPGEDLKDVELTLNFIEKISKTGQINVAFSIFVPKKTTPWQNEKMLETTQLKKRLKFLKQKLSSIKVKGTFQSITEAVRHNYLASVGAELSQEYDIIARQKRDSVCFKNNSFFIDFS